MGVGAIPPAADVVVSDAELDAVEADIRRRQLGMSNVTMVVIGVAFIILAGAELLRAFSAFNVGMLVCGLTYCGFGVFRKSGVPGALRTNHIEFFDDGIRLEFLYGQQGLFPYHRCSWREIRAIDDVGDCFVVRPYFRTRAVIAKSAFADRGIAARAFFTAHGVAGRVSSAQPDTVLA